MDVIKNFDGRFSEGGEKAFYTLQDTPPPSDMRFWVGLGTCGVVLEIPYRKFFFYEAPVAGWN